MYLCTYVCLYIYVYIHMYIFLARTKVVAYADELLIATRGKSVREVENFANLELSKIERWSRKK